MIGIEIITGKLEASFGPRLEAFYNEHPNAELISLKMRGIEGGKGMIAILKYLKEEPIPEPKPKITVAQKKVDAEAEAKALKKVELEAQLEALK